ncbi:hypothetical protein BMF94_1515 [Rhodotorula taiwanensis]|uniref:Bet v I/Major latex protein domain-containing protein n=1 Tax=Rhodotorula taiwanensis TaxID=741276 RepID=A0A2S5BFB8_9BASI|nr:hypothetical protein BMF94_1515 [Rhodotorula taiwanensis]
MSSPATGNFVSVSAVIRAPLTSVWHLIKLQDFAKWWSALEKSAPAEKGVSGEADVYSWTFKASQVECWSARNRETDLHPTHEQDGTSLLVKQEEHSALRHSISYSVVTSEQPLSYSSVISTISLAAVTTGELAGSTFVTWTGQFSSDADAGVVEDAKYKREEALADLAKAVKA